MVRCRCKSDVFVNLKPLLERDFIFFREYDHGKYVSLELGVSKDTYKKYYNEAKGQSDYPIISLSELGNIDRILKEKGVNCFYINDKKRLYRLG